MSEEAEDKQEAVNALLYVPLMFGFIMIMAGLLFTFLRFQAESSAKLTSHAIAGVFTAVSSAPQNAVYCMEMPGGIKKNAYIRKFDLEGKKASSVLVASDQGNFRTDVPVSTAEFSDITFKMPAGTKYVLRVTKRTPKRAKADNKDELELDYFEEEVDEVICNAVV